LNPYENPSACFFPFLGGDPTYQLEALFSIPRASAVFFFPVERNEEALPLETIYPRVKNLPEDFSRPPLRCLDGLTKLFPDARTPFDPLYKFRARMLLSPSQAGRSFRGEAKSPVFFVLPPRRYARPGFSPVSSSRAIYYPPLTLNSLIGDLFSHSFPPGSTFLEKEISSFFNLIPFEFIERKRDFPLSFLGILDLPPEAFAQPSLPQLYQSLC